MTKAENISYLCLLIRSNVKHSFDSIFDAAWGYATRLNDVAARGGFASEDTTEVMDLDKTIGALREMADSLQLVRNKLVDNYIGKAN